MLPAISAIEKTETGRRGYIGGNSKCSAPKDDFFKGLFHVGKHTLVRSFHIHIKNGNQLIPAALASHHFNT